MDDKWAEKELILNQKHLELLKRREALLQGSERYYDFSLKQPASFIFDIGKAMARNKQLMEEINLSMDQLIRENQESTKFNLIKNNYWTMVRNVFPVWYSEMREYEAQKQSASKANNSRPTNAKDTRQDSTKVSFNEPGKRSKQPQDRLISSSAQQSSFRAKSSSAESLNHSPRKSVHEPVRRSRSKTSCDR